ncbi:WW domain binding protein 11-domain-containing protein [Coniella lustricola]|uniref:WW domain binding protein 11-domain-containing protein n=1 Tax=Coniella lustricola TaxID=2025994 RepID=A0A2T3AA79_9PEZI|nr:WW domain binding protein 11-domain-containing protein [Coniella lustricola]
MAKEKNFNPVQAQRKADKAKAIKKGKADVAAKRNERLAKRNPERIQQQIDDLKAIGTGGGKLSQHEEQVLSGLEKELKAVQKARETLGDAAPQFKRGGPSRDDGNDRGVLGKRRRNFNDVDSSSDSDVPEDVKAIPMPRDTPPPVPKEVLDKWWAKRRAKRNANTNASTNANTEPLGRDRGVGGEVVQGDDATLTSVSAPAPVAEAKTVYEAKPIVRDLRKEAAAFVPTIVRQKLDKSQGHGGLMEPEEADRLEREGYLRSAVNAAQDTETVTALASKTVTVEEVEDEDE